MNFTDELAAFRARTADPGYAALIVLGTRQATTAALLLGTLKLERVAFLLTAESAGMPDDIALLLGCESAAWQRRPLKGLSAVEVYEALKDLLAEWHDLPRAAIAADVTGGTKPMTVGLAKAAHVLNLPTLYIASDFAPDERGIPRPVAGSQRLELLPDPYAVFGDLEAAEAHRLYAAYDYAGAHPIFADLAARVPNDDGARYAALAELAALYAAWDVLDFAAVLAHADRLLALPLAAIADRPGMPRGGCTGCATSLRRWWPGGAIWRCGSMPAPAPTPTTAARWSRRASLICGTPRRCCCAIASTAAYSIRPSW